MRLASFEIGDTQRLGLGDANDRLVDVTDALRTALGVAPNMLDVIKAADDLLPLIAEAASDAALPRYGEADVRWLAPVPVPGKICGIAMNNSASNERKISAPEHPAFFLKPSSCLIGHRTAIRVRSYYGSVHPEPELAVIIGKTARDVAAHDAHDYIFGYSIFDDITGNGMRAEDLFQYWALYLTEGGELEKREQHLSYAGRYKGSDTFGCMGPWLVTADAVPNPDDLDVFCSVGGETVAEDSTRYYNYKVAELLSFISQFQTLEAGDVISCGTAFKPSVKRKSIHQADLQSVAGPVEVRIESLGVLVNPVELEQRDIGKWRL